MPPRVASKGSAAPHAVATPHGGQSGAGRQLPASLPPPPTVPGAAQAPPRLPCHLVTGQRYYGLCGPPGFDTGRLEVDLQLVNASAQLISTLVGRVRPAIA